MINYILETNICIYLLKQKPVQIYQKYNSINPDTIGVSSISVAELMYGINKSSVPDKICLRNRVANMLQMVDFDYQAALRYGVIKNSLLRKGMPKRPLDMLIAAHAVSLNVTLVSNNLKEFNHVDGLLTENWI